MTSEQKKYRVPAIEKAAGILNLIVEHPSQLRLIDISRKMDVSKSSIFVLLNSMCDVGWLTKNRDGTYALGVFIGAAGASYFNQFDILRTFDFEATQTVKRINETIQLSILDGPDIVYLRKIDAEKPVRLATSPGQRLPAYATAMGKIFLSQFSYEELRARYGGDVLTPRTSHTVRTLRDLINQFDLFRREGYMYESQEGFEGFSCIAAPIYGSRGNIIAAISITLLDSEKSPRHDEFVHEILDLSSRLSKRAGYTGDLININNSKGMSNY